MKILITGASGFIGTNLVENYVARGVEVLNFDIDTPRTPPHVAFWRKGDIRDRNKLVCTVKDFRPDRIINLAAATGAHRPTFGGAKTSAERSQLHTNYADLGEDER